MTTTTQRNRLSQLPSSQLSRDFGDLFQSFFDGNRAAARPAWYAPASVWEEENHFHIEMDVPGVVEGDLEITFEKGTLSISADRKSSEVERTNWHDERGYGKVTRLFTLPDSADAESIEAELSAGVLHVSVGKKAEAQPKKISIRSVS